MGRVGCKVKDRKQSSNQIYSLSSGDKKGKEKESRQSSVKGLM
jgi:hypothetical protein